MTPKEKVSELMQKFYYFNTEGETPQPLTKNEAKKLSLFVAQQVIEQEQCWIDATKTRIGGNFWQEVKQELEQL